MATKGYLKKKVAAKSDKPKKGGELPSKRIIDDGVVSRLRNQEIKERAQRDFTSMAESRKRYDWEWLTRDLYRRGYQFSRYNPSSRTVILSSRGQVKIPINLAWSQMRVVRNQVTSFRPKWETLPRGKTEEAVTNARYSGKLLDYYYDKLKLRKILKDTVMQGLTYSVGGPWEIGYDPDANDGEGEVYIWLIDTYDFYVDPNATSLDDAEFCGKAVRMPLDAIKKNPDYQFYEVPVKGEFRVAESEYKQFLIQSLKMYGYREESEEEGAILKKVYIKIRVAEDNKKDLAKELRANEQDADDLRIGETIIRVVTYLDFVQDPLKVELLRRSDFPFVLYQADVNPVEVYGESWLKHLIPMNRVLNSLESSIYDYHYRYAKGRIVIDKNSGVRLISNQHGDIIEKNRGSEVTSLALQPLPASYQNQIENMRRYIEDIGGAHDVSLGRLPTGVKSGIGIAELKSADATNQQDLVDALEDFLVEVGQKLLHEISENYDVPRVVKALGKGGDPEHFAVVGEKGSKRRRNKREVKMGTDVFDIAVIGKDNEIRVTVGSWLAYTKSAQYEKMKELFTAGIIDQKTFLEHAEFSDIQNIVDRTREEEVLRKFRGTPAEQGMPGDEEIAEQENFMMIHEGKTPDAEPTDAHQVHLVVHQEALGSMGNPIVEAHMAQHEDFIKQGLTEQAEVLGGPMPPPGAGEVSPAGPGEPGMPLPGGPVQRAGMPAPSAAQIGPPTSGPQEGSPEEAALMAAIGGLGGQ